MLRMNWCDEMRGCSPWIECCWKKLQCIAADTLNDRERLMLQQRPIARLAAPSMIIGIVNVILEVHQRSAGMRLRSSSYNLCRIHVPMCSLYLFPEEHRAETGRSKKQNSRFRSCDRDDLSIFRAHAVQHRLTFGSTQRGRESDSRAIARGNLTYRITCVPATPDRM